jgi:hypothetical protein
MGPLRADRDDYGMNETRKPGMKDWEHVHLCPKCGHTLHPDQIELGAIMLGVITCPVCERSGPINLQIVERTDP